MRIEQPISANIPLVHSKVSNKPLERLRTEGMPIDLVGSWILCQKISEAEHAYSAALVTLIAQNVCDQEIVCKQVNPYSHTPWPQGTITIGPDRIGNTAPLGDQNTYLVELIPTRGIVTDDVNATILRMLYEGCAISVLQDLRDKPFLKGYPSDMVPVVELVPALSATRLQVTYKHDTPVRIEGTTRIVCKVWLVPAKMKKRVRSV